MFHAISHQTEGTGNARQVVVNKSTAADTGKEGHTEVCDKYWDIFQNNMVEGPKDPQGPFFYQEGGKTYASLPMEMLQNIQKSPLFEKMQKDCQAEGIQNPQDINGKGPCNPCVNPTRNI